VLRQEIVAMQQKMRLNIQSPYRVDRKEIDTTSVITLWEELLGPHCQKKSSTRLKKIKHNDNPTPA
jgi:hypothetical protein